MMSNRFAAALAFDKSVWALRHSWCHRWCSRLSLPEPGCFWRKAGARCWPRYCFPALPACG
jgi:hypothetical protein